MDTNNFVNLSLCEPILRALSGEGYHTPTSIQLAAIPEILAGNDLLATAQTGTGKTAAFSLPILQLLHTRQLKEPREISALILTPTRELALQVEQNMRCYGRNLRLRTAVVLGGVPFSSQIKAIKQRPDILVATPGRLLDLIRQRIVKLSNVELLVLDEADRMLDMGFVEDVRTIISKLSPSRQSLLFSATMSAKIKELASFMLNDPAKVDVTPAISVSTNIEQKVFFVEQKRKQDLLRELLKDRQVSRALVFTRTKRQANNLSEQLYAEGISSEAIHSNKSQNARQRTLTAFHRGKIRVLVATDVVARGIDVDGISHVINFELPEDPESYVHRIGRTARAGAVGKALSLCAADEIGLLKGIERLTKSSIASIEDHPYHSANIAALRTRGGSSHPRFSRGGPRGRNSNSRSKGGRRFGRSSAAY